MDNKILNSDQENLLSKLENLNEYYLAGGTAIALQLSHRKSIDFDFFANKEVSLAEIKRILVNCDIQNTIISNIDQYTAIVDQVKITFLNYPYLLNPSVNYKNILMPDLLTLAATKAFTIGRRPKWKDYVDLYFLIHKFGIKRIIERAEEVFQGMFNDKLFREQLLFFEDIDFTEEVDFISDPISKDQIKKELEAFALET